MAAEAEKNYVHQDENWRQRVRYETESQKNFSSDWGFLAAETADSQPIKYDTRLVKYFNPAGGTWTVREKRVPERRPDGVMGEDALVPSSTLKSAMGAAIISHQGVMESMPSNVALIPTSASYGKRHSLEQFGISHYGRVRSRSKEPTN